MGLARQIRRLKKTRKATGSKKRRKALIEALEPRLLLSADLNQVEDGLRGSFFEELQEVLNSSVFDEAIPLLGDQLSSEVPGQFADEIGAALEGFTVSPGASVADVKAALTDALGSRLKAGTGISTFSSADGALTEFQLTLAGTVTDVLDLDLALGENPFLQPLIGIQDAVAVTADWEFRLTFGVQESAGVSEFFVNTSAADELGISVSGRLKEDFMAVGRVGLFSALFQADQGSDSQPALPSLLTAGYSLDLRDPDNRLTPAEYGSLGLAGTVTGRGEVHFDMDAAFIPDLDEWSNGEFPGVPEAERSRLFNVAIQADVTITHDLRKTFSPSAAATSSGALPRVRFDDVRLDMGEFFQGFIGPTFGVMKPVLEPIMEPLSVLTEPLPVVSDMFELVTGREFRLINLTTVGTGFGAQKALEQFVKYSRAGLQFRITSHGFDTAAESISRAYQVASQTVPTSSDLMGHWESVGSFEVEVGDSVRVVDSDPLPGFLDRFRTHAPLAVKDFFTSFGQALRFPVLENTTMLFDLLIGKSAGVEMFRFGTEFDLDLEFTLTLPIYKGILNAELSLMIGSSLDLDFSYDALGLDRLSRALDYSGGLSGLQTSLVNAALLRDGFVLDDHNPDLYADGEVSIPSELFGLPLTNGEAPEFVLFAKLGVGASFGPDIGFFAAKAGARGYLQADLWADLNDLPARLPEDQWREPEAAWSVRHQYPFDPAAFQYDGLVRLGEQDLVNLVDPGAILNLGGDLRFGLELFVKVLVLGIPVVDESVTILDLALFDWASDQPDDAEILSGEPLFQPTIGAVDADGTLRLYTGPLAALRSVAVGETNEKVIVESRGLTNPLNPEAGETVVVTLQDFYRATFEGVKRIEADGGAGADVFLVKEGVLADVSLKGGAGDDRLTTLGAGSAELDGGIGNDRLDGGPGADLLRGGEGNDILRGGAGVDELYGEAGDDQLFGKAGDDVLDGGADNDRLYGEAGEDTVQGGAGDDLLDGGPGLDVLSGGTGSDRYFWEMSAEADTCVEGGDAPADTDVLAVRAGSNPSDDTISVGRSGSLVRVATSEATLFLEQIEGLTIAAGKGSDTIGVSALAGTDLRRLVLDLQDAGEEAGAGTDTVQYAGGPESDRITLRAAAVDDEQTLESAGSATQAVSAQVVFIEDEGSGVETIITNTSPARDRLVVRGGEGDDEIVVSAGTDGLRVQDLIGVTLDGGGGDDVLRSVYSDVEILGGSGNDRLIINDDGYGYGLPNVMLFDGLDPDQDVMVHVEDGLRLSTSLGSLLRRSDDLYSSVVAANPDADVFMLEKNDGSAFSLNTLDVRLRGDVPQTLTFTGVLAGGGTVTQTFYVDEAGFQTLAFAPEFRNLASVSWRPGLTATDNIVAERPSLMVGRGGTDTGTVLVHRPGLADTVARFSGIDALQIDLGSGEVGNRVQVLGTIDGPVTINGSSGNDVVFAETIQGPMAVNLADGNDVVRVGKDGTLAFVGEDIQVNGGPGKDRVILDAASEVPVQAVIGSLATSVLGASEAVRYDTSVEVVELQAGMSDDLVAIPDLSRRIVVYGGEGHDSVNVTLADGVSPGAATTFGVEDVSLTDSRTGPSGDWVLEDIANPESGGLPANNSRVRIGEDPVLQTYDGVMSSLTLTAGDENVMVLDVNHETRISLGGGRDEVQVGLAEESLFKNLDDVLAPLILSGEGADHLILYDAEAGSERQAGTIEPDRVTGFGMPGEAWIGHRGFQNLTVHALDDTGYDVTVLDTVIPTTLDLGSGADRVEVEGAHAALTIGMGDEADQAVITAAAAVVEIDGGQGSGDRVEFDGEERTAPLDGSLTGDSGQGRLSVGDLVAEALFRNVEQVDIVLGSRNDTFSIDDTLAGVAVNVLGQEGDDRVVVDTIGGPTDFVGGPGVDILTVNVPGDPALAQLGDLTFSIEQLIVDNSAYAAGANWKVGSGALFADSHEVLPVDGAEEVRILAGSGTDTLEIEEVTGPVAATIEANRITLVRGAVVLEPSGFVHDGTLLAGISVKSLTDPKAVAVVPDPAGDFVYVRDAEGSVTVLRKTGTGLRFVQLLDADDAGLRPGEGGAVDLEASPDFSYLYASTGGEPDRIMVYSRDPGTGMLSQVHVYRDQAYGGTHGFISGGAAPAGDLNNDGIDDLIVGGQYLVFGRTDGFPATLAPSEWVGAGAYRMDGAQVSAVAPAGDVNGDGVDDLIIGDQWFGSYRGASYVLFGGEANLQWMDGADGTTDGVIAVSRLDGVHGFRLEGIGGSSTAWGGDWVGSSVASAGDANGDGVDDLLIGARGVLSNRGAACVLFGRRTDTDGDGLDEDPFAAVMNLSILDGTKGYRLVGVDPEVVAPNGWFRYFNGDWCGQSVSGAGDVNGDGLSDLLIGAPNANGGIPHNDPPYSLNAYRGETYVVFGGAANLQALDTADGVTDGTLSLSRLNGPSGFRLDGELANERIGLSVATAGDLNADGYDDVIVTGEVRAVGYGRPLSYVVFGRAGGFSAGISLAGLNGTDGFRLDGGYASVAPAGDMNGDGLDDLLVGGGATTLLFGRDAGFGASLNLENLNTAMGLRLYGAGNPVACAGDVNGDGSPDIITGGYVVFGGERLKELDRAQGPSDARIDLSLLGEFPGIDGISSMALSPDGRHLYSAAAEEGTIVVFAVGSDGGLTSSQIVGGLAGVDGLSVNEDGTRLYVTAGNGAWVYTRDPVSGALTFMYRLGSDGTQVRDLTSAGSLDQEPNDEAPFANDLTGSFTVIDPATPSDPTATRLRRAVVSGTIGSETDEDFFRFQASSGDVVTLSLNGVTLSNPFLWLYDRYGNVIASNDNSTGLNSQIVFTNFAYAGDYYAVADAAGGATGTYSLTVEQQFPGPRTEPETRAANNDAAARAVDLTGSFVPTGTNTYQARITGSMDPFFTGTAIDITNSLRIAHPNPSELDDYVLQGPVLSDGYAVKAIDGNSAGSNFNLSQWSTVLSYRYTPMNILGALSSPDWNAGGSKDTGTPLIPATNVGSPHWQVYLGSLYEITSISISNLNVYWDFSGATFGVSVYDHPVNWGYLGSAYLDQPRFGVTYSPDASRQISSGWGQRYGTLDITLPGTTLDNRIIGDRVLVELSQWGTSPGLGLGEVRVYGRPISDDLDYFKIHADAGDSVAVSLVSDAGRFPERIELRNSGNGLITAVNGETLTYTFNTSGDYYVVTDSTNLNGRGTYTLNMTRTTPSQTLATSIAEPAATAEVQVPGGGLGDTRFLYVGGANPSGQNTFQAFDVSGVLPRPRLLQTIDVLGEVYDIQTGGNSDEFVYVSHREAGADGAVTVYRRLDNGTLTALDSFGLSTADASDAMRSIGLAVAGNRVVVTDAAGQSLTVLAFDGADLTEDTRFSHNDPYFIPLSDLESVTVSPDGHQVYGVNPGNGTLLVLDAEDLSWAASYIDGLDGADGLSGASQVTVSPDGGRVYVASPGESAVGVFDRDAATGKLTLAAKLPMDLSDFGVLRTLSVSPDSQSLYVGFGGGIACFDAASLTLVNQASALGPDVRAMAVSPDGQAVYVAGNGELRRYGADLGASPQVIGGLEGASAVRVSPDGKVVYVALADEDAVVVFEELGGALNADPVQWVREGFFGVRGIGGANGIGMSPDGAYLYVTGGRGNSLAVFEREISTGRVQFAQVYRNSGELGLESPNSISVGPDGKVFIGSSDGLGERNGGVAAYDDLEPVVRGVTFAVSFEGMEELTLATGAYQDALQQVTPADVEATTLLTGGGADTVRLLALGGLTTLDTGADEDIVDISAGDSGASFTLTAGDEADVIRLWRLGEATQADVDSGSGQDVIQVSGARLAADSLIRLDGGEGEDTLLFDPAGQAIDPALPLPGTGSLKVMGPGFGTVQYERVEEVPGFQAAEADAGGMVTIHEGESLTLVGTATAATNTQIVSLVWEINGSRVEVKGAGLLYDEVQNVYSATTSLTWEQLKGFGLDDDGQYTIYVRALDDLGRIAEDEGTVNILETAPAIAFTGDSTSEVGEDYEVLFSALDPGDDLVTRWTIHWGDGLVEVLGSDAARAGHAYATTGDYAISLSAEDEDGTYTTGISVQVMPAIPQTGGPYKILEGQSLQLHAAVAGTPELAWDLDGDGEFDDAIGKDPLLSWLQLQALHIPIADSGAYGVQARAMYTDYGSAATQSSVGSGSLMVLNAPPSAVFGNTGPVNEGDAVTVSFADVVDPSSADQAWGFTYSFDLNNDGAFDIVESSSPSAGLTAPDAGSLVVVGRVADKDGGHKDYLTAVAVREVAPTFQVTGSDSVDEGSVYSLVLGAVDQGSDVISQWVVDWGDGSPDQVIKAPAASLTHVFADDGAVDVSIVAVDEDGIYEMTNPVVVRNVAPALLMAGQPSLAEGGEYTLFLGVEDPGADTLSEWTIDWGDGTVEALAGDARSRSHIYEDDSAGRPGGTYRIRVTAVDEDATPGAPYTVSRVASLSRPLFHFIGETGSTGHFYQLTSHEGSWAEAQADAETLGGYLASVLSMEEQAFLESAFLEGDQAAGRLWIGLTDALDEGVFQWATGESLDYSNWAVGQPDDAGGGQDYGALVRQTNDGRFILGFGGLADGVSDYLEHGFRFSTTGSFAFTNGLSGPGLRAGTQGETFRLEDADGGVFALQSLQISSAIDRSIVFVGTRPDGSTVTRTFEIAGSAAPAYQKMIFGPEFAGLTSVSWSAGDTVVDDIQVSRPLSLWLDESGSEALMGVLELNSITGMPAVAGDELLVTVGNEAPVAFLSGPGEVDEGSVFALTVAPPVDPGADTVTAYVIDWGDGSAPQRVEPPGADPYGRLGSLLVSHLYKDGDADHSVSLQIEDEDGLHNSSEAVAVHVTNVAPSLSISGASHALEGLPYALSLGPLYDPGEDTLFRCTVDWGDGNLEDFAGLGNVTHTYYGAGTRDISISVTDEDGAYSLLAAMSIAVSDAPPTVALSGASSVDEGSFYTLTLGEATDPGAPGDPLDVEQYIVHWGDGTSDTSTEPGEVTHRYLDGDFEHTILVDLEVGGAAYLNASSLPVMVRNVAPTISLTGAPMVDEGSTYLLSLGEVIDPGADTVTEYVVDWGDGTVESFSTPGQLEHSYLEGVTTPVIAVTLGDEDGRHDGGTQSVEVKNVAPVITTLSVSKPAVTPNEEVTLSGAFTDRGILDTHAATIDWGDGTITDAVITESGGSGSFLGSHIYGRGGTFDIHVTLKDDDGAAASDSERVIVTGADLKDGVLYIAGTAGDDRVSVNQACGSIMVHANFLSGRNHVRTFKASDVKRIEMYLGDGNDHAQIAGNIDLPVTIDGGAGDDHLNAGRGPAVLIGGDGNDKLIGSRGNDKIYGGAGNDFILGGGGNDLLDGGSGNDKIYGSCGNDVILGGDGNDRLFGGWGDDQLLGGDGNDLLVGGPGKDTLEGGGGKDKLIDWSCKSQKHDPCHHTKIQPCSLWVKSFVEDIKGVGDKHNPNSKIQVALAPQCSADRSTGRAGKK